MKLRTFKMQGDMKEDINSNTLSTGKANQLLMIAGLAIKTYTYQNSSRNSTNRPPWVDKKYKDTLRFP
jgi:hypothetical protein